MSREMSAAEQEYLNDLKAAGIKTDGEAEAPAKEMEGVAPAVPEPSAPVASLAAPPAASTDPAPAAPITPAAPEPELFQGFSNLDPTLQKTLRERWAESEEAKRLREEMAQRQNEIGRDRARAQQAQQMNARLQSEFERANGEVVRLREELKKRTTDTTSADWKRYKEQFPEEAALHEANLAPLQSELAEAKNQLGQMRAQFAQQQWKAEVEAEFPKWQEQINSPEFKAWASAHEDQELMSQKYRSGTAGDSKFVLRQFNRDLALAELMSQKTPEAPAQAQATPARAAQPTPTPEIDPDPTRRSNPASVTPITYKSEEERQHAEVVAKLGHLVQRRR